MSNPNQLLLLADHVKLSLLERQRAISLNIESNSQDGHISRSLDSLREGLDSLSREQERVADSGDVAGASDLQDTLSNLQTQYDDLTAQFHGHATKQSKSTLSHPNDPSLSADFARAASTGQPARPRVASSSSFLKKSHRRGDPDSPGPKSVRFSDHASFQQAATNRNELLEDDNDAAEEATRNALFPYRDDPHADDEAATRPPDQSGLDNQQIHAYHSRVLAEQDEQLDRLGESIGRQRELSIQIGDELDGQVDMLDEMDGHVERHQSRLDQARKSLGKVARKANDNKQLTTIFVLIVVLVLLIVVLK